MSTDLRWCVVDAQDRKVPVWARSAALAQDGTVFIPAAIGGAEMQVTLCAGYDGVTLVQSHNHVYVPAKWLQQEYPKATELVMKIERSVREFFA